MPPRKGRRHVLRVVRDILHFQPKQPGTNIETALAFVDRLLKPHSVVFLISDFKDTGYEKQLRLSSKRHSLIAMILQDRRELELPNVGLIELADAETGETVVIDTRSEAARQSYREHNQRADNERRQMFRSSQIDAIHIRTDESYVKPLIRFFPPTRFAKLKPVRL